MQDKSNAEEMSGQEIDNKTIIVQSKDIRKITDTFAADRANYGVPAIVVRRVDENGLLRLEHLEEDKINVDVKYAEKVLEYIWKIWNRPVELVRKDKDVTWILSYDGRSFESDYQDSTYPECVEEKAPPSSW